MPARLSARVREHFGETLHSPEVLIRTAADVTMALARGEDSSHEAALDLLAADAVVTHAIEQMADDPTQLDDRCAAAMIVLASIVEAK